MLTTEPHWHADDYTSFHKKRWKHVFALCWENNPRKENLIWIFRGKKSETIFKFYDVSTFFKWIIKRVHFSETIETRCQQNFRDSNNKKSGRARKSQGHKQNHLKKLTLYFSFWKHFAKWFTIHSTPILSLKQ